MFPEFLFIAFSHCLFQFVYLYFFNQYTFFKTVTLNFAWNVCLFVFIVAESPDTEAAMDLGASEVMESEILYDCVICGQSGPSTEDRPTGLVVLLQASSGNSFASNFIFQHEKLKLMERTYSPFYPYTASLKSSLCWLSDL